MQLIFFKVKTLLNSAFNPPMWIPPYKFITTRDLKFYDKKYCVTAGKNLTCSVRGEPSGRELPSLCDTRIWVVLQSGYAAAEGNIMASVKNSKTCLWKVTILADWNLWGPPTAAKIPFKMINKWLKYACKRNFWQNQAFRFNFVNFWPSELFISNMI